MELIDDDIWQLTAPFIAKVFHNTLASVLRRIGVSHGVEAMNRCNERMSPIKGGAGCGAKRARLFLFHRLEFSGPFQNWMATC